MLSCVPLARCVCVMEERPRMIAWIIAYLPTRTLVKATHTRHMDARTLRKTDAHHSHRLFLPTTPLSPPLSPPLTPPHTPYPSHTAEHMHTYTPNTHTQDRASSSVYCSLIPHATSAPPTKTARLLCTGQWTGNQHTRWACCWRLELILTSWTGTTTTPCTRSTAAVIRTPSTYSTTNTI